MTIEKVLAAVANALAPLPTLAGPIALGFTSGNRSASAQLARCDGDLIGALDGKSDAPDRSHSRTVVPFTSEGTHSFSINSTDFVLGVC